MIYSAKLLSIVCLMVLLATVQPCVGQEVIIHNSFEEDDGNPAKDADGVKNGVVVFKGNAIHVGYCTAGNGQTLRIEPGAIVKISGSISIVNGKTVYEPPSYGSQLGSQPASGSEPAGTIQIDGAIITDIRDDDEGGDTNGDGSATTPPATASSLVIEVQLSESGQDYIKNSKLKYIASIGQLGSATIANNHFIMFGGLTSNSYELEILRGTPVLSGNTFEFLTYGGSKFGLHMRGVSAIIQGNTFRYAAGADRPSTNFSYDPVISIGLIAWAYDRRTLTVYPQQGTTVINNNIFETGGGIALNSSIDTKSGGQAYGLLTQSHYRVQIQENTFNGASSVGGRGNVAMTIATAAEAVVTGNQVTSYDRAIDFDIGKIEDMVPQLLINHNRFTDCQTMHTGGLSSSGGLDTLWKRGWFINAESNYWGDPSGPYDRFDIDGLYNPRGKGLEILQGVNYIPFIGGTTPPLADAIQLSASSTPVPPLLPNATVTLNASASYQLKSAPTGKILVSVQDKDGIVLNPLDQPISVTSQSSVATIPPLQVKIPELGNLVTVEAVLTPDGGGGLVGSNIVPFVVAAPTRAFTLLGFRDADLGGVPLPIRGNKLKLKVDFRYTYAAGDVVVELTARDRMMGNGTILTDFPPASAVYQAGTDRTDSMAFAVDLPLRDVTVYPKTDLYCELTMKTVGGSVIGKQGMAFGIDPGGSVRIEFVAPAGFSGIPGSMLYSNGRDYYEIGEYPAYGILFGYDIRTKSVNDWVIWIGNDEALDAKGNVIYQYTSMGPVLSDASTGSRTGIKKGMGAYTTIPSGTRTFRIYLQLKTSGNMTVAYATYDIEVRDKSVRTAQKAVPAGATQVAFNPIPATLNFTSNQNAGTAFAEEFAGQFGSSAGLAKQNMLMKVNDFTWDFIPLNRYWSVYDTLQDGTFSATLSFTYDPAVDFPSDPGFSEDSLVIAALSPLSNALEALPSTLNKATHTISTPYSKLFDTWVVASKSTTLLVTGISSTDRSVLPERYILEQNYPNPFNPTTVINYQLSVNSFVTLKIYDILGREVATLISARKNAGYYNATFDGEHLPSGIYFYRLQADSYIETKKLVLLK